MTPILVFDLETVPDVDGLRRAWGLAGSDDEVAQQAFELRRAKTGSDFLPHHLQRIVAIGCVLRTEKSLRVRCLGEPETGEGELVATFFDLVERHRPQLVTWNGGGFDLPVLGYRALIHGVSAPRFWDWGDDDRDFKFNNYLNRYHTRHLDLMDVLGMFTNRANAPLDDVAKLCGFPGKLGMDGSRVWDAYRAGALADIRAYCETDVMNTWLVYARFQRMRGVLGDEQYADETRLARDTLAQLPGPHWREYLDAWR